MLENNLKRQTTKRRKDLFPEVHLPLRKGHVSAHNKLGLLHPGVCAPTPPPGGLVTGNVTEDSSVLFRAVDLDVIWSSFENLFVRLAA
jgi:hypothetical protein